MLETKARINESVFSAATIEWATPQKLFDGLNAEFHFTLDPCATPENAKCHKFFTKETNGLVQSWRNERVFMNPPYGKDMPLWIRKAFEESRGGALVVCLIPARTDTKAWHKYVMCSASEIRFIQGRVVFEGAKWNAPFPSAIVIFRPLEMKSFSQRPTGLFG